ncbi:hypothetical protein AMATHDRAFT_49137 [Amanita thiersii Skay4041]|uniref:Uncharacterized protein n=1 Tax=Amanita thiersii Skay4041 TaxID=703135 RepID=A0A2A9NME8_9AGAR|nr:hypothetical protein AMATHDRAFT_49137 [Amanita thiersii Skay4041]
MFWTSLAANLFSTPYQVCEQNLYESVDSSYGATVTYDIHPEEYGILSSDTSLFWPEYEVNKSNKNFTSQLPFLRMTSKLPGVFGDTGPDKVIKYEQHCSICNDLVPIFKSPK